MILHIDKIDLCGSIKAHVLLDDLNQDQLKAIGYNLPIGQSNYNFKIEVIGSFEADCSYDHECYIECFDFSLIGPGGTLNIDDHLDLEAIGTQLEIEHSAAIWQDWYEGLADAYEYSFEDR